MDYPRHVAFIPDWNRTRAKQQWKTSLQWHLEWLDRCVELALYIFCNTDVEVFTLWWLSTENLKNRTQAELSYLFELYKRITDDLYEAFRKHHVNFRVAWDKTGLPKNLVSFLEDRESEFKFSDSKKTFVLAINYWWQDEILRAIQELKESWDSVTKENLEKYMDFGWLPTVDLVIRTKQQLAKRLSGFMLWRIWYAQLYFTDLYCPQFTAEEFEKAVAWWRNSLESQNLGK